MIYLVDGNNWAWRAFHVGGDLSSQGRPTGVLFVSLSMLSAFENLVEPGRLIFLWDAPPYWRKDVMPGYKNRNTNTGDRKKIYPQIDLFRKLLTHVGIAQAISPGLEADDLAGIYTKFLLGKGNSITLVSGDRDWFQLLGSNVRQLRGWKGKKTEFWTEKELLRDYGVKAKDWHRWIALVGDDGDDIPKALNRGRGEKVAREILTGKKQMLTEEVSQYEKNLQVSKILTDINPTLRRSSYIPGIRNEVGFDYLTEVILDFEFFTLYGERDRIWKVGGWR